ncbi:hypothetical protein BGO18_04445 [Candidatus Saccharibacteria bacterium 47-87]|nr:hypothetical protein [Candidatus Saccharibacteria bacterium]OJU97379.1 MAG: hypothetical protein BGO18_04445 [Candidatus Saccharibacteria bacterium 47-87]
MEEKISFWDRHRLSLLLVITVGIATVLTCVSVAIYNMSGAAQLDLSRPGYLSVSSQAEKTDSINGYSSTGSVNKQTIQSFLKQYDEQIQKAKSVDAFSGDPLNPDVLEFGTPASE